jgi:hypothetical protein
MSEPQTEKKGVIEFGKKELDPDEEKAYREKIDKARAGGVNALKGQTPVGHVPRLSGTPVLSKESLPTTGGLQPDGSVAPRPPGSPVLSAQTAAQLEALGKAQEGQAKLDEAEVKKAAEEEDFFDSAFDFAGRGEAERILNNKKRRKEIEARCDPMKFEDLLYKDEVQQVVPIMPEKFEPTFRSFSPEESLFIKQIMSREPNQNDQYLLEKFSLAQLTCALVSINGKPLPDHRDKDGSPDEKLFRDKLKTITKKSAYIVADLMINYAWFDLRVRRLLNPDDLKNG